MSDHWFWLILIIAVVAWYSSVTIYVAIRGAKDIRTMLSDLARRQEESNDV